MRRLFAWAGVLALAAVGAVVAVAGAVVSRFVLWLGVSVPWGLVFVMVTTAMFFWSARSGLGRAGVASGAVGWVAGIGLLLWPRSGGDVVVGNDWLGMLFLLGGMVAGAWNIGRSLSRRSDADHTSG